MSPVAGRPVAFRTSTPSTRPSRPRRHRCCAGCRASSSSSASATARTRSVARAQIVDNAHFVGYALETATRPVFDRAPTIETLSHELAHQWFGDDVTLRRWRDIWLNEGFAEFSSWLWDEHRGAKTAAQHLADLMSIPASQTGEWLPPPGNPGSADRVFSASVYDRGAGTLEALRKKLGDRVFFRILRGWVRGHAYGNATVPQFTAYAQQVSHRDLTQFFQEWLYKRGKPTA
jgi:aminopeptidase N